MNKNKLLGIIKENNDTQEGLADALNITRQTLSKKINETNGASFTLSELKIIRIRYKLNESDFNAIFFADLVS